MTRSGGDGEGTEAADVAETARRMTRALDYLIRVSTAAGLSRVAMRLVTAQAELLVASAPRLGETEHAAGEDEPRPTDPRRLH